MNIFLNEYRCMQDDIEPIDDVGFSILKVIRDAGRPLWKTRVKDVLNDRRDELPILGIVSVQTVGRRIDDLYNEGLLETAVVRPKETDRDLVIAFELTEKGEEAVMERRQAYLRNIVRRDIFRDFRDENVPQQPLLQAIKDEFNLSDDATEKLAGRFDSMELASMLALYYVEIESQALFTEEERQFIRQVARGEKTMNEAVDELE